MRKYINVLESSLLPEATVFKAPQDVDFQGRKVFLAGSIDMGRAVDWQTQVTEALSDIDCAVMNPRRDDWDTSWVQDISNKKFAEQVNWELDCLERADVICMYFDPKGEAPITLLELGLHAASGKIVCCCPEGFWRRGNVQIVCERAGIPLVDTLDELIELTREKLA